MDRSLALDSQDPFDEADRMWWDPKVSAWRVAPDAFSALLPSEVARLGWRYLGPD